MKKDNRVTFDMYLTARNRHYISILQKDSGDFLNSVIMSLIENIITEKAVFKRSKEDRIKLTTRIDPALLEKYDRICKASGLSRTEYFNQWMKLKLTMKDMVK